MPSGGGGGGNAREKAEGYVASRQGRRCVIKRCCDAGPVAVRTQGDLSGLYLGSGKGRKSLTSLPCACSSAV